MITAFIDYHRATGRWRPNTEKTRKIQLRNLAEFLHPIQLADATENDIVAWHAQLRGRPETVASYISAAKGLYRWMIVRARPRLRDEDPTLVLERPRIPAALPRPMANHHYDLALACAVSDPEMYIWLGLMGCSGFRCCEIAWLQTHDIESLPDGAGLAHITGKGGKRRTVPVGRMLMTTMRPFLRGGPVFTRVSDGAPHSPTMVSMRTNRFLRGIGVHETAHSLRHRFGGDYHALDPDLYRQAKIMGHASVDTTQRYTEVSPLEAARYIELMTTQRLLGRSARPATDGEWPGSHAA
ncbi:tyrosine-type recombinase/integrase [Pseudonocardia sp. WMMC193]|uniref:tyrosine-type recombinase/integrase n=1 Tax=Pseudonocardia sp. WMMC193 TaxID=2911965 RepID=UPI001F0248D5|nr:tyrosine-type recombinase/integrase [Pseudonocardia sp. WMMC193]MCF7550947.1 tyrosine-type recombinase/integrase [Pseudonocardia sp. WMMC193]